MKGHLPYIAIISALIIVIAIKTCQPPREDVTDDKISGLQDTIRQDRQKIAMLTDTIQRLLDKRTLDSSKSIVRQSGFKIEISKLKDLAVDQRQAIDSLLQRNPPILDFIATQDTIISRQATEIVHLQEDLRASEQTSQELTQAYETQVRLQARVTGEFEQIVSVQGQQIVKLEKKVRNHKVLGWIALGVGFVGGVLIAK